MDYEEFIRSKSHKLTDGGFEPIFVPKMAFDFQKYVIEKSCKRGRNANFLDTGLGKTLIQLSIAQNIVLKTNNKVLILTPLAVAFQFLAEAEKIGIDDIEYSKNGSHSKKIVVTNYERLHLFNEKDFSGIVLDESSILKNFKGQFKTQVTSFSRKIDYRFLSTATPSPNDFTELGTSSEILGYMGYMDMLSKFFKSNENSIDSNNKNIGEKFYLKPHAENDFFAWVNQWSTMIKKPSDVGFSDERYILPQLTVNDHFVDSVNMVDAEGQASLFPVVAKRMQDVRHEQKTTEKTRCEKAVELAEGKTSVYWCNTNSESSLLKSLDSGAVEIKGSQSIEEKEDILISFAKGEIDRLITKAKITGMGLNWQHCNHSVFFPTFSYEQYYQSIRRFWRFGQTKPVTIDLVLSEGQQRVIEAIKEKTQKAQDLYQNLTKNVNSDFSETKKQFNQTIKGPTWLKIK